MSFSEDEAIKLLQNLDNTQHSVESTSQWFLEYGDMAKDLVKLWFKEFRKASPKKKIAFLHLANDVIQKSVVLAPQFGKLFEPVLPAAFKETAKIQRHSVRASVAHLLIVWATRRVYSKNFLRQLRFICQRAVAEADTPDASEEVKRNIIAASPFAFSFSTVLLNPPVSSVCTESGVDGNDGVTSGGSVSNKINRKLRSVNKQFNQNSISFDPDLFGAKEQPCDSITAFREELARELQTEAMQPPKIGEFIQLIEALQSAASADAATRREIAEFPPEISDIIKAKELIKNSSELEKHELIKRITGCASRLDEYNQLLEEETSKRNQLAVQLRTFHSNLHEQINQLKTEIDDTKAKVDHSQALKDELRKHVLNLPDLNLLPDMTMRLDPLPTVSDLFG